MSTKDKFRLGLDIGGSSIKYGWGNCQQGLQFFSHKPLTQRSLSCLKETVVSILEETDRLCGLDSIVAIGIGSPGTIDSSTGKIAGVNPNLPFWVGHDPAELIPSSLSLPVFCDNDANLMCLGEAWLRGSRGLIVGVTIGSGIGCGFVSDGAVYHGAHGFALELGHVIHIPQGELCSCGRRGCVEAYASVDGIRRRILRLKEIRQDCGPEPSLIQIMQRSDNSLVSRIIDEGMHALALGLANLCVILDPDTVVIGGGAMDGGLYDWDKFQDLFQSELPLANRPRTSLEKALEGNRAGVLGAVVLASQSDVFA
ncbi:MAG: ROK family protein [Candidatus Syntrophosphaera sp.]|nr:ROK family protein [Candidatus Syntrophosphaera sp.]